MNGPESSQPPEKVPQTKPATAGGPPDPPPPPPKAIARDLMEPDDPEKHIFIPDYIEVRELAIILKLKPFQVVADLLKIRIFKTFEEYIDFKTAATVARKWGFTPEKLM
jgi:hypothetical protein